MTIIENKHYDEERALYRSRDLTLRHISFDGPADGESALKESQNISLTAGFCNLRYPFWHVDGLTLSSVDMTDKCRAALWYTRNAQIANCSLHGIKAVRECENISLTDCDIVSPEFGWFTNGLQMTDCSVESEYFMLRSRGLHFERVALDGKYSFQYVEDALIAHSSLNTKDAFWHARNVTVCNTLIRSEYLGWYSDGLILDNCTIYGTQPLCWCRNLRIINCKFYDADLAFEKSEVEATITTPMLSIKNPRAGIIQVPAVGEEIRDDPEAAGRILLTAP